MKFPYAIFDMDGLLFDTERLFLESFETAVSRETGYTFAREKLMQLIGVNGETTRKMFPELFPGCPLSCDGCFAIGHAWMRDYFDTKGMPCKPGARELLDWLRERKIPCALATSSDRSAAQSYLARSGLTDYFSVIISGDQVTRSKPDPQPFQLAMQALGASRPEQCVVFEDSRNGLLAGANGGFPVILVPDLTDPDEQLPGLCYAKCRTLKDAISVLEKS